MINAGFSIAILEYTSIRVYQLSPSLTSNPVFEATLTFRHGEALREEVPWNGNSQKRSKSWIRSKHILTGKCDSCFFFGGLLYCSISFEISLWSYFFGWMAEDIVANFVSVLDSFTKRWTCHQHCGVFKHIYDIYKLSRYSRSWCNIVFQLKPKLSDVLCSGFNGIWSLRTGIERQERYHICSRKHVNWKNHENYRVLFWFGILWLCLCNHKIEIGTSHARRIFWPRESLTIRSLKCRQVNADLSMFSSWGGPLPLSFILCYGR